MYPCHALNFLKFLKKGMQIVKNKIVGLEEKNTLNTFVWMNVAVVLFVAANLRAPFTAIGPVLNEMSTVLNLTNVQASLLTSIPLLMFAGFSMWISHLSAKNNTSKMLLLGMIVMFLGSLFRVYGNVSMLMIGSVFIGLGICVGNVVVPGYIKKNLSNHIGLMTGMFALFMNLVAAFASGLSVDIGKWTHWAWKGSIGIWSILELAAIIILMLELMFIYKGNTTVPKDNSSSTFKMYRSRLAWQISVFMGLQSVIYYSLVAWLPAVLISYGMSDAETGWVLFAFQMSALPFSFLGPVIANKMKDQRKLIYFVSLLLFVSMIMFVIDKIRFAYIAAILIGASNGFAFSMCLLFFSIRTQSVANAVKLSGMAQSIGYLIAAFGPMVFGGLRKFDKSWDLSLYFIVLIGILILYFGSAASRDLKVENS